MAPATTRPVQWVALPGGLEHGSASTCATVSSGTRRLSGLARLVPQQSVHALLGITHLPAPHRRTAEADPLGNIKNWQALGRQKNDPCSLDVFERAVAIPDHRCQTRAVLRGDDDADCLCHAHRLARSSRFVNPLNASMHWRSTPCCPAMRMSRRGSSVRRLGAG